MRRISAVIFFSALYALSFSASGQTPSGEQVRLGPGAPSTPEWPGWGGPRRDFSTASKGLGTAWTAAGPPKRWTRPLGDGHSSIAVDGNRLYTMYRPSSGVRGKWLAEEAIVSLDASSGKTVWEHRFPSSLETMDFSRGSGPHTTPLIAGARLFTVSTDKQFFALDKHTGKVLWSHAFVKEYKARPNQMRWAVKPGYGSSPLAYGDTVITVVGAPDYGVVAYRQSDGSIAWKTPDFPDEITPASPILIVLDGEEQLVVTSGDAIHGFNPKDGSRLWSHQFPTRSGVNITTPLWLADQRTLVSSAAYDGGTRAVQLTRAGGKTTAKELWFSPRMRVHFSNIVRVGEHLFGSSGDFGPSFLTAVHVKTGEVAWQDRTFSKASFLLLADGRVVLLDEDGTLAVATLGPDKLTVHAHAEAATATSWTVPTLIGATLYLRDRVNIMAFDLGGRP
jgi:outer membrane protein assembly factor BamB